MRDSAALSQSGPSQSGPSQSGPSQSGLSPSPLAEAGTTPTTLGSEEGPAPAQERDRPDGGLEHGDLNHGGLEHGDLERAERQALRRVTGLSTELTDITEVEYRRLRLERVVLVGVWTEGSSAQADASLQELARLATTAGSEVLDGLIQRRGKPDPATFIGSGKVVEVRQVVTETGADTVIFDGELAPGQLRQLEEKLKVKVIDRTALILDIFAQHARSREGKAQVELAQLNYLVTRLRGWGQTLSRQAGGRAGGGNGGVGLRGPGETKLETDRRRITKRIAKLRNEMQQLGRTRSTKRGRRRANRVPSVAIAGYTNAGKSSLLNRLTSAGVLVEDSLFATLDPTTRRARTHEGTEYTLTDTVGFVRHLPHQLVEAFRSTLEEVAEADLLLHVVDGAEPAPEGQIEAVREVLTEVGKDADEMPPELVVVNKLDAMTPADAAALRALVPGAVFVSAQTGQGVAEVLRRIEEALPHPDTQIDALLPFAQGSLVSRVHQEGTVLDQEHTETGTRVRVLAREDLAGALRPYRL